ncbi:MAG: hypothetical protein JXB23_02520 [Candidatus Aminicenantes bacterium]|nr:hypothetical protein [Candidatus Aminicenantes bacterium]
MTSDKDFADSYAFDKYTSSVIEEIEAKMKDALERKRKDLEHELEERIRLEKEEASKKINQLESELKGNQETLVQYKNILSQLETDKENLKNEIKDRFTKAVQLQKEIEEKTGLSLEELNTVAELIKDIEEIKQNASEKINSLRSILEGKYGIEARDLEINGHDEIHFDLESTLTRLQRVKDLLADSKEPLA